MNRFGGWFVGAALAAATVGFLAPHSKRSLIVEATAYNSVAHQTNSKPWIGAWGDPLDPDAKIIAVSRDLLKQGLRRGVEVEIEGIPGTFVVLDKMGRRWKRRIDIHMGDDVGAAEEWGLREVRIRW